MWSLCLLQADRCVADNDGAMFKRLLADIKDLNLGKVPELQERANKQIISFSKHLCGGMLTFDLKS
jgi:hypothetical protein